MIFAGDQHRRSFDFNHVEIRAPSLPKHLDRRVEQRCHGGSDGGVCGRHVHLYGCSSVVVVVVAMEGKEEEKEEKEEAGREERKGGEGGGRREEGEKLTAIQ